MDIDKLILICTMTGTGTSFSSLMDIDKLIPCEDSGLGFAGFSSLMDIDKLIHGDIRYQ